MSEAETIRALRAEVAELRAKLLWVMENTQAGHRTADLFQVSWLDRNVSPRATRGVDYEDAIAKAMLTDVETEDQTSLEFIG